MPIIIILLVLIIILLVTNIRVVPQATEFVIERLGTTTPPGRPACTLRCRWWTVWPSASR